VANQGLLQPHPQNKANREVQAKEQAIIGRCKDEQRQWVRIINRTKQKLDQAVVDTHAKRNKNAEPDLRDAGWMTDALRIADEIIAEGDGDLTKMGEFEDVEFKVGALVWAGYAADRRWTRCSARRMSPCNTRGRRNAFSTVSSRRLRPTCEDGNGMGCRPHCRQEKAMGRTRSPCWQLRPHRRPRRPPLRGHRAKRIRCSCSALWRLRTRRRKTTRR
jgi:hypothetical protein